MFAKILIANRGEIACRVIRTARHLGIATVAVYSKVDAGALHVEMADAAYCIGPAAVRESYLNIRAIIEAAKASGAEAVHPGYGFLSENADFAEACAAANLIFIGPSPAAMRAMGSKAAAKALMQAHGMPVVPGYHGDDQEPARLLAEAARLGWPVLIKASAGGGGRGMRVVAKAEEFPAALDSAKREAKAAFGDDSVLLERYLDRPRHIEMQVFGDGHGNVVHLYERDCSIQRRHQKIIEEAPAPGLDPAMRREMGAAAVAAARAVGYVGAGTVEFIVEDGRFYFMEMNTRLQVEHPVTEAVTGLDLVEWQLRVAAGETLPLRQEQIVLAGHAIEARLYAESPERGFLPATGMLHCLRLPPPETARVDAGIRQGDAVTPFYDPLIAKIIVRGEDRASARARLARARVERAPLGFAANLAFLARAVADPEFAAGPVDTGFVERRRAALLPSPQPVPDVARAAAALQLLLQQCSDARERRTPWAAVDGWRLNLGAAPQRLLLRRDGEEPAVEATATADGWRLQLGERCCYATAKRVDGRLVVTLDGIALALIVLQHGPEIGVFHHGANWRFEIVDALAPPADANAGAGRLTAPMPGRVIELLVAPGAAVRRGQPMMVIEAMKMEHVIAAPRDGVVETVRYAAGDLVEEGAELIALTSGEATRD
jgi:3-methylcrotonyl-CoA carboxylase alpha subunit